MVENDNPNDEGGSAEGGSSAGSELPVLGLTFAHSTLKIIEDSKIKKLIGPLIASAHASGVRKIGVLSWDDEASTRYTAQLLTVSFAQQLEKKCALIVIEGIRFNTDVYESFNLITLPEINDPNSSYAEKINAFVEELDRTYPFQVVVGPCMNTWSRYTAKTMNIIQKTDAHILLIPESGLNKTAMKAVERLTKEYKIKWLGTIGLTRESQ